MARKWYLESPLDDTPDVEKKRYRVVGVAPLHLDDTTVETGDEFEAALKPHFEQQMLSGGHLVVVGEEPVRRPLAKPKSSGVNVLGRQSENTESPDSGVTVHRQGEE